MGILAPFYSTYLSPFVVLLNFFWIALLGLGTALVVIGIPRGTFLLIERAKNKREAEELKERMEEEAESESDSEF